MYIPQPCTVKLHKCLPLPTMISSTEKFLKGIYLPIQKFTFPRQGEFCKADMPHAAQLPDCKYLAAIYRVFWGKIKKDPPHPPPKPRKILR